MATLLQTSAYHFGPFVLDLKARKLCLDDTAVPITQKELLTLILLVEAAGEAVGREALIRAIWPDTVVGDTSLGRNISVLRRHLGADAIESVPKFGYRFTLPVTVVETPAVVPEAALAAAPVEASVPVELEPSTPLMAGRRFSTNLLASVAASALILGISFAAWKTLRPHAAGPAAVASAPAVIRLAVLPFHNSSARPAETDYLRDGFNDALSARLGALEPRELRVLARGTTRQYLDSAKPPATIAAESGAHYLIEGSIGFSGGRTQLMASLVNPADQTIIWSRTFAGPVDELGTIEGEIAEAVGSNIDLPHRSDRARELAPTVLATAHVVPAAYDEYLRGRFELEQKNLDGYRRALGHFQTASMLDPNYAEAWAGTAETYIFMGGIVPMNECFRKARVAALKAIELDPALSDAHRDLAYILMNDESDLRGAEREYKRAIELNLNDARAHHWYSQLLAAERRDAESLAEATAGYELDPRSIGSESNYGFMLIAAGNPARGIEVLEELVKREPSTDYAWGYLGFGYLRLQRFEAAAEAFDRAAALGTLKVNYSACAAYARARGGDRAPARAALADLQAMQRAGKWVPAQSMVMVYLALGERELARQWLLRGAEDRTTTLFEANTEPVYSEMKDDPGFPEVVSRLQKAQ